MAATTAIKIDRSLSTPANTVAAKLNYTVTAMKYCSCLAGILFNTQLPNKKKEYAWKSKHWDHFDLSSAKNHFFILFLLRNFGALKYFSLQWRIMRAKRDSRKKYELLISFVYLLFSTSVLFVKRIPCIIDICLINYCRVIYWQF